MKMGSYVRLATGVSCPGGGEVAAVGRCFEEHAGARASAALGTGTGTGIGCQFLGLMQIGWCPSESCNVTVANVTCEFFRHTLRGQA